MYNLMAERATPRDEGFTLVELVIVMVLLGIFASVVITIVFEFRGDTDANSCSTDARTLQTAVEAFMAQNGLDEIPAAGASDDRYEITLVDAKILRDVSDLHDLDETGALSLADGSPCTLS